MKFEGPVIRTRLIRWIRRPADLSATNCQSLWKHAIWVAEKSYFLNKNPTLNMSYNTIAVVCLNKNKIYPKPKRYTTHWKILSARVSNTAISLFVLCHCYLILTVSELWYFSYSVLASGRWRSWCHINPCSQDWSTWFGKLDFASSSQVLFIHIYIVMVEFIQT